MTREEMKDSMAYLERNKMDHLRVTDSRTRRLNPAYMNRKLAQHDCPTWLKEHWCGRSWTVLVLVSETGERVWIDASENEFPFSRYWDVRLKSDGSDYYARRELVGIPVVL